jgi:hypothetical protein
MNGHLGPMAVIIIIPGQLEGKSIQAVLPESLSVSGGPDPPMRRSAVPWTRLFGPDFASLHYSCPGTRRTQLVMRQLTRFVRTCLSSGPRFVEEVELNQRAPVLAFVQGW